MPTSLIQFSKFTITFKNLLLPFKNEIVFSQKILYIFKFTILFTNKTNQRLNKFTTHVKRKNISITYLIFLYSQDKLTQRAHHELTSYSVKLKFELFN